MTNGTVRFGDDCIVNIKGRGLLHSTTHHQYNQH